jgi:hypothetical protein
MRVYVGPGSLRKTFGPWLCHMRHICSILPLRSRTESLRYQYLGNSPLHASTVELVRNLQTGSITPQFHMVFDDYFEMVHSAEDQEPEQWNDLLTFSRFKQV